MKLLDYLVRDERGYRARSIDKCGTLVRASQMERIDGQLVCADCNS